MLEEDDRQAVLLRFGSQMVVLVVVLALLFFGRNMLATLAQPEETSIESVAVQVEAEALTPTIESVAVNVVVDSADSSEQFFDLSNLPTLQDNSLVPAHDPTTYRGKLPTHTIDTYVVQPYDTPVGIADKFNIRAETILGGNPQLSEESNLLQVETELLILPIDGVLHTVRTGETLEGISNLYGIAIDEIVAYEPNNLEFPFRLYAETQILVPGAVRDVFVWEPPSLESVRASNSYWASQSQPLIIGTGTFLWPVSGRRITQTYWYGHQAIDVGIPTGSPLYAADSGTITYAAWSPYCFGNLIVVNHGNGFETFYAHLSGINVVPGQIIYQGNLMGYTGNTGCSSGPHLHFEIRANGNRDNPINWLR